MGRLRTAGIFISSPALNAAGATATKISLIIMIIIVIVIIIIIIIIIISNDNNMGTGVGQVGSLAYHRNVDDPAHQSLGWCLWQITVTPSHPCQGYDKGVQ